ncbi:RluA family pseudouridine synthase [Thermoproteota archaeon]
MEKQNFKIDVESAQVRIDVFIAKNIREYSRTSIKNLITSGQVLVNEKIVKPHYILKAGDSIEVIIPTKKESPLAAQDLPLKIIYEDSDVIVVNKPCGMVVHPAAGNPDRTLVNALLHHTKDLSSVNPERPGIVHRLDKETSGVMVVAKNNFTHLELVKQFKVHSIKRRYIALVKGKVEFREGMIDLPLGRHHTSRKKMAISFDAHSREAQTYYRTIKRFSNFTLLELIPRTGRTHQLRVHLSHLKHPILGDSKYGNKNDFPRLALHAKDLGFSHPRTERFLEFSCELPEEIKKAIGEIEI